MSDVGQENKLSDEQKKAIAGITEHSRTIAGQPYVLPFAKDASGHADPTFKDVLNASDNSERAEKLAQIIAAHPNDKGMVDQVAKLITGAKVQYYTDIHNDLPTDARWVAQAGPDSIAELPVAARNATEIAAHKIQEIKQGIITENNKGEIGGDGYQEPSLKVLIQSALDQDGALHTVPSQKNLPTNKDTSSKSPGIA